MPTVSLTVCGVILLSLAAATVVEREWGTQTALKYIYHSAWMIALWCVGLISMILLVAGNRRRMRLPAMTLHVALALILIGAGVTHFFGENGVVTLSGDGNGCNYFKTDGGNLSEFPFTLAVNDFGIGYYDGTDSPSDYFSDIQYRDGDGAWTHVRVSMNRYADIDGYRFCQSSMTATDTTLTVNHDPYGVGISYAGYMLLFVSMVGVLIDPKGRFGRMLRLSMVTAAVAVSVTATASTADDGLRVLQRPLAKSFGHLYIYSSGRVMPLSTFAREFCLKVYGRDSYRGFTPEQVLTGWMFYYDDWKREPMIQVKSQAARRALGTSDSRVSLESFGRGGTYILETPLKDNPDDSKLAADNERVAVVTSLVGGRSLRILPSVNDKMETRWLGLDEISSTDMEDISRAIYHGRYNEANALVHQLRRKQISVVGEKNLPTRLQFETELIYNRSVYLMTAAMLLIVCGVAAVAVRGRMMRRVSVFFAFTGLIYISLLIGMRWIIGKHIPLATGFETMMALAWFILLSAVVLCRRYGDLTAVGLIGGGCSLMVASLGAKDPAIGQLTPVLASPLLSVHVMLVMASYSLFAMITVNSVLSFTGAAGNVRRRYRLSVIMLYPAVMLLGGGIFTGAIWANESWGRYWGWDPKETWALITFIIYALPFHGGLFRWLNSPRWLNTYLVAAFMAVLMTYLGVNYLMSGLHSYGAN